MAGYNYEMGGTWVTHFQSHLLREMQRYGMDVDLVTTPRRGYANEYYTMTVPGLAMRQLSHENAGDLQRRAWDLFVNVDGVECRKICPLPHQQLGNVMVDNEEIRKVDSMSCWDRYQQIKDQLNAEESGLLLSLLLHISGGNLKNSSLWDMIRSHSLTAHSSANFDEAWLLYKLRPGQSALAAAMFYDAVRDGLDYSLSTEVVSIHQESRLVRVRTTTGQCYTARRAICTIPLNVLHGIQFDPPLSTKRQEAIRIGHVNFMNKIHAEVQGSGLASWNGMCYPNIFLYGYGDGLLPNGNAHIVAFGTDERPGFIAERDPEQAVAAFQRLHPMEIKKMVTLRRPFFFDRVVKRQRESPKLTVFFRSSTTGPLIHTRRVDRPGGRPTS